MEKRGISRLFWLGGAFLLAWGVIRYGLPLAAPFLLGFLLARLAEPVTSVIHCRLGLPRAAAAGIAVTLVLAAMVTVLLLLGGLCCRELAGLMRALPDYAQALEGRFAQLRDWALSLAGRAPGSLGTSLTALVSGLFTEGGMLLQQLGTAALSLAGGLAGRIPGGALMLGTAVISAYMISAQYPALRCRLGQSGLLGPRWARVIARLGETLGLWFRAQLRLSGTTLAIVGAGLLLLRVEHWLLWAVVIALVDAIPMLGTGTVLIPMALIALLWGQQVRGIGLLGLYLTAMLTRSALEPRLVGRQLGMNPLATLMALYAGYQIWGVMGMILSPVLAVTATGLMQASD